MCKPGRTVAMFYALQKRREFSVQQKISFKHGAHLFRNFYREFSKLPPQEQHKYKLMWTNETTKRKLLEEQHTEDMVRLESYNCVSEPVYLGLKQKLSA